MFRQALTASSRALRSTPRLAANSVILRPQFQTAVPSASLRAFRPAVSRWYSDAKETKEEPAATESTEKKEEAKGDADVIAELKKNLEAKETEAREWKVRT